MHDSCLFESGNKAVSNIVLASSFEEYETYSEVVKESATQTFREARQSLLPYKLYQHVEEKFSIRLDGEGSREAARDMRKEEEYDTESKIPIMEPATVS